MEIHVLILENRCQWFLGKLNDSVFFVQTVKGELTETRVEKKIVIQADGDLDHDKVILDGSNDLW